MLKEDGYIFDDGVVARLARDRFHVTTTTGGAARVLQHMEDYLQTEWPGLDVYLTSITEQYAVIAVQGPKSREVIAPLVDGIDLGKEAFPHMSVRTGAVCGVPGRLVADPGQPTPIRSLGHVTSSYWSPSYGRSIALALVAAGRSLIGERLFATTPGGFAKVGVCNPVFFDRTGARVNG